MESHFSAPDSLALALFDGPHILSNMLLESFTLRDIREIMIKNKINSSKSIFFVINYRY